MKTPTPLIDKTNENITRQNKYLIFFFEVHDFYQKILSYNSDFILVIKKRYIQYHYSMKVSNKTKIIV